MKTARFQSFEQLSSPEKGPERLVALRAEMEKEKLDEAKKTFDEDKDKFDKYMDDLTAKGDDIAK